MFLTDERLFCEELDTSIPALKDIAETFKNKGTEAAEKQLADYVRGAMRPNDYFKIPYYERENAWARSTDDDFAAAERIISGELCSVGKPHKFPDTEHIEWKSNPTYNDYKEWTWQLSRHHEWRCLGWCYRQTGDEKYAKAFVDFLMSWCEQAEFPENAPGGATECWRTIEVGIRMTKNWHYAFHAFLHSEKLTDHVITTYIKSVWEHGYRLRTRATGGNWLIMEMAGLSHIGMLYPFFNNAAEWADFAFDKLSSEIDVQVYPDGFQFELSTNYHNVVVQNYHWVLCTADAIGYPVPKALSDNLLRMFELNIKIVCPNGRFPDLNDGGKSPLSFWCEMGKKYFPDHPQIKYFATDGKEGDIPEYTSIALPYAGHAYMRTGWEKSDMWAFMDAGPFGRGHQHEDKLNVLMFAYGKEVMPDMGNYSYDTSDMRRFVLSTYSHNCGLVDGMGQNRRPKYKWLPEMIAQRSDMKWAFSEEIDAVEGIYNEGYGPLFTDVTHKRKLIFFKKGVPGTLPFAVVIDRYTANDGKEHEFATSFQMDRQEYTVEGKSYTAQHGDGVTMSVIGCIEPKVLVAQKTPCYIGWRKRSGADSEDFEHFHAPCLQYIGSGREKRIVTVLYPSNNGEVAVKDAVISDDFNDTTVKLTLADGSVITLDENDYPVSADACEMLK